MPDFTSNTYVPFSGIHHRQHHHHGEHARPCGRPAERRATCSAAATSTSSASRHSRARRPPASSLFFDETDAQPVLPITSYNGTLTLHELGQRASHPGTSISGKGYKSAVKNNRLLIGGTLAIGAGQLYCSGLLWGVQEL